MNFEEATTAPTLKSGVHGYEIGADPCSSHRMMTKIHLDVTWTRRCPVSISLFPRVRAYAWWNRNGWIRHIKLFMGASLWQKEQPHNERNHHHQRRATEHPNRNCVIQTYFFVVVLSNKKKHLEHTSTKLRLSDRNGHAFVAKYAHPMNWNETRGCMLSTWELQRSFKYLLLLLFVIAT